MALVHQRIRRIFFAFPNPDAGALGSVHRLQGETSLNHHYAVFRVLVPQQILSREGWNFNYQMSTNEMRILVWLCSASAHLWTRLRHCFTRKPTQLNSTRLLTDWLVSHYPFSQERKQSKASMLQAQEDFICLSTSTFVTLFIMQCFIN